MSTASVSAWTRAHPRLGIARRRGAVRALILRDWRIMRTYRTALVTDVAFGFLNLAVYFYLSRTLRMGARHGLGGAPTYFAFAAAGVALAVVLQGAVTGVARRLREEQLTGTLEALLAQPISGVELAFGLAGFPCLFAIVRAAMYLLLAGVFFGLGLGHCDWVGLPVAFLASGVAFAALGVGLAAVVLVFKRAEAVGAVAAFGLCLLGGAFFPVAVFPSWLRPLGDVVPTHYAFAAVRDALFGHPGWIRDVAALAATGTVTMLAALALFGTAIRHAVRRGTLNQY